MSSTSAAIKAKPCKQDSQEPRKEESASRSHLFVFLLRVTTECHPNRWMFTLVKYTTDEFIFMDSSKIVSNDSKKRVCFHFSWREIAKKSSAEHFVVVPPRVSMLWGHRNLLMPQLRVLSFLVSWFYSPSPLILSPDMPPGLPMTCSATKHSEIVDSSFSEYAFWLDTQIQRPFSLYHTQRLKRSMSLEIEAFKKNHKFGKSGIRFNLQTILFSTLSLWSREVLSIQSVIPLWWKGLLDYSPPDP